MPVGFSQFTPYINNQNTQAKSISQPVYSLTTQANQVSINNTQKRKVNIALIIGSLAVIGAAAFGGVKLIKKLISNAAKDTVKAPAKNLINEAYERMKVYPELIKHADESKILKTRMDEKFDHKQFDIDYYKDLFRLNTTISSERLKVVREANDPKLRAIFDSDRNMFDIQNGVMIYGSDRPEKKELINYFIDEAKKHDFEVIRIPAGDTNGVQFEQNVARLFPEARKRFLNERKQTMFVIEDVDKILEKPGDVREGGIGRGAWNTNAEDCGREGIITLTTARNKANIDDSSLRRISEKINIDEAVKLSEHPAEN